MIPGLKKRVLNLHDVIMYVAIARKHLRLMFLLLSASMCAGLVYYVYARPVYFSRSLVQMDYLPLPVDTDKIYHDGRIRSVMRELTAPHIVERTARKLGLRGSSREIGLKYILKTTVHQNSEKNIEIEVWPTSAPLAHKWAETLIAEFLAYRKEKRARDRDEIFEAYTRETEEVRNKLVDNIGKRFDFKDERDSQKTLIELNEMRSIPVELVRIRKRLDDLGRVRVQVQDPALNSVTKLSLIATVAAKAPEINFLGSMLQEANLGDETEPRDHKNGGQTSSNSTVVLPSMISSDKPWEGLEKEQQRIKNAVQEASQTYLPGHLKMIALHKQLDEIEKHLDAEFQVAKNRLDVEFQHLLNKKQDLEQKLPQYADVNKKADLIKLDSTLFDNGQLRWNSIYKQMMQRIEAIDFANDKERIDLTFAGITDIHDEPVSPNRAKLVVFSLILGIILALGVPFLIEYLDHTLSNLEQVESAFQLRGLGIVPKIETSDAPTLIDHEESKRTSLVENFRVIRTNLLSMGSLSKAPHVMMVTSAMPKEGKTVVSSNLAISFAHMGARTLLIDTDLRRGRLHRLFGYRKSPGLSNVLLGEATIEEACRPTTHENLTMLSAGRHLETGTELLGSEKFSALMALLRSKYDRIVIDTPPVLGLSETSVLQKHMDGVLFVIWSGHTPIRNMKAAIEMLQANGANFYGFVLNRLDLSATQNYYQYYYYSHDYYYHTQTLENA